MILLLIITVWIIMQTPWGQNWLAKQVTSRLSRDLQTRISIDRVDFSFFNKMNLEGVLVEDRKQDTLIYAGKLQVRITDWFFFKDKADLKYIGLENAVVHFNRTDSVWNYKFLQDYFAPAPGANPKKKAGISFDIKVAELKNVVFVQQDAWRGQDIIIRFDELDMNANELTISGKNIDINSLSLVKPEFRLANYTGKKPGQPVVMHENIDIDDPKKIDSLLQWNSAGMDLRIGTLSIQDGRFMTDKKDGSIPLAHFDGKHIDFSSINGNLRNVHWTNDTIKSIVNLSAKERSGLEVKSLKANMKLHPEAMIFEDFGLMVNNSMLRDYFAMHFEKFSDMNEFIHKVRMEANFSLSDIHSDDIGFFAPNVRSWDKRIRVSGKVRGTVDEIKGDGLVIQAGPNTFLNGDITLSGLPDIEQTFIDFKANDFKTTYADAVTMVPNLRRITSPRLSKLQYVHFNGSFTGFVSDFVTFGTINTALGTVRSDLNMKLPKGGQPIYSGTIATNNFRLGEFVGTTDVGVISMDASVSGRGFNPKTIVADFDGKVRSFEYNNYNYQNIVAKGRLAQQQFEGFFSIDDPNAILTMDGVIDFGTKIPKFNLEAVVDRANLFALNLAKNQLDFNGKFHLNFAGDNIDNFLGDARIYEASLIKDGNRLSFDSLSLSSQYVNNVKTLTVRSNEFDAIVEGEFDVNSLPEAFKLFLNKYYPAYIQAPRTALTGQNFTFDITTRNVEEYIPMISKDLSGFNNSHVKGSLNTSLNQMTLEAEVPLFGYKQYSFSNALIKGDGNLDRLVLTGDVGNVVISDSLHLPETKFSIEARNDISDISITTTATQGINQVSLAAQVQTYNDGVKVTFNPSSFVLNEKTWVIEQGGELEFRSNSVTQGELRLTEGQQEITLRTVPSEIGNWNDLEVNLKNLNLGDLSPFIMKNSRLEGIASGNIHVEDPQKKMIITSDIVTNELRLDDDSIGHAVAKVYYDNRTGELRVTGSNEDLVHKLNFNANIFLKDTANLRENRITIAPENYPVKLLERFIGNLFSDLRGYVTGSLDIVGEGSDMRYIGKGRLRDAGLKVNFTQVFYKILDTEIDLTEEGIDFGSLKLLDSITGRTATVKGTIAHKAWKNMFFDLYAKVDNEPITLLNTKYTDNQQFYGKAFGTGSMSLTGPQSNMFMDIDAKASEQDSSLIILPPAQSRVSGGMAEFLVERKYGREMTSTDVLGAETNITYQVRVAANPMVSMEVILDDLTGDVIRGKGNGDLFISAGTNEPMTMIGKFQLVEGKYDFTFQSLFKKPFELIPSEENYIEWTGNPYDATINIHTIYRAVDVSFAPLTQLPGISSSLGNYRGEVYVVAKLTGELFKPQFNFKLEFPDNNLARNEPGFAFSMSQIQANPNEINRQVTYLIVFNSFAPVENATASGYALNEFAYNTISGLVFGEVNRKLNQLLSKILNNNDLTLNFSGSLYNRNLLDEASSGTGNELQGNFNLTLAKSLFNNRLTISFGSTLDVPLQSTISQTVQFLPDVTLEWKINPSGSITATFFYRENLDYLTTGSASTSSSRVRRTGASISYRKNFNKFSEIFKKRKPVPVTTDSTTVTTPSAGGQ